jgi:hypothetical protein
MFAGIRFAGSAAVLCVALGLAASVIFCETAWAEKRPEGVQGQQADRLAERMLAATNAAAWQSTGAVGWTFRGDREHLWDRQRSLARVRWGRFEVLLDLTTLKSVARKGGRKVEGAELDKAARKAFGYWTNDSFWLNPVSKVFDEGTSRSLVELDGGGQGLLVEYTSGGLTPGDAYLWIVDEDGLPTEWRMWVSALPVGGARASWEDWIVLATGARVATRHDLALGKVVLSDVAGASDLAGLGFREDPFAELMADLGSR